jgi:hypothetical protein
MPRTNQEWCTMIAEEIISTEESYVASLQQFHNLGQFCRSALSTDEFNYFFTPCMHIRTTNVSDKHLTHTKTVPVST